MQLCEQINIVAEMCPDHVHMLVKITPKISASGFVGFLSSLLIQERLRNLNCQHGNRSFWCKGYYVDTAGKNTKNIQDEST